MPTPVAPQYLPVTGNRNTRKQKEPDKFEGDKVEWADFIAHFEMVARWNDWTYTEKGLQLATCLRGKAQKVLGSIPESQRSDYEAMKSALEKRFSPPHRENAFRAVFRQRKRESKESLMDFGSDVMRLAQRAYPEFNYTALDQVARDQLVRGLPDVDMKRHVDLGSSSSLDEAISLATQYESFEMGESSASLNSRLEIKGKSRSNTKTAPVQNESEANAASLDKLSSLFDKKFEALNKQVTTSLANMNARLESIASEKRAGTDKPARQFNQGRKWNNPPPNPQGNKANMGNCYGCGEPGHYKRNCPKLRARTNSQGTSVPKRADSPVAPGTDTGTNNKGDNNSKRNESRRVTQSQKVTDIKGGYVASGLVQGMPVDLLIDSGSDVTLIDVEVYNQIPESVRPLLTETETNLSTASGSPMTMSGQARFELQLGNSEWSYPFIVAELDMTTKAILGNNFLRDQESNIDMKLGAVFSKDV